MFGLRSCCQQVNRKKPLQPDYLCTELRRCLGVFDLILLGISGMLGAGLYVLTGAVAKDTSGPGVILSYLFAAVAAFLSALCYAEFGARIPSTGSSYIFTYVTMGELWGFLMGWNMVLEHGVGSASVAKAWSGYLDSVMGYPIKNFLGEKIHMGNGSPLGEYPDFVGAAVILLLCAFVSSGAKSSTRFNMVFAVINIAVVLFIIVTGFCLADLRNWSQDKGGFLPFGFSGVIAGASRCFFAFAGFDVIASSCEEARNPKRDIPIALAISLLLATVSYVGVSSVLTLMVPWDDIVPKSSIPDAYGRHSGWQWAQVIVTVGSLCTMTTSMFSGLFVMPRILYAISKDGLLCPVLSSVNEKTQVPLASVGFTALLCSVMALLFDLETLVQFMSIGTLTAYSFVAACVILLRYGAVGEVIVILPSPPPECQEHPKCKPEAIMETTNEETPPDHLQVNDIAGELKGNRAMKQKAASETSSLLTAKMTEEKATEIYEDVNSAKEKESSVEYDVPDKKGASKLKPYFRGMWLEKVLCGYDTGSVILISLVICVGSSTVGMILVLQFGDRLIHGTWWTVVLFLVATMVTVSSLLVICSHQQIQPSGYDQKSFQVPCVPIVPLLCITTNIFFMLKLQAMTWIRLLIWIAVGFLIYFFYGFHHSQLNPHREEKHCIDVFWSKTKNFALNLVHKQREDKEQLIPGEAGEE